MLGTQQAIRRPTGFGDYGEFTFKFSGVFSRSLTTQNVQYRYLPNSNLGFIPVNIYIRRR